MQPGALASAQPCHIHLSQQAQKACVQPAQWPPEVVEAEKGARQCQTMKAVGVEQVHQRKGGDSELETRRDLENICRG